MNKWRKKPIVVEAEQFFPEKLPWPDGVFESNKGIALSNVVPCWYISTLEGMHEVSSGDWIITGIIGEKYPCKPNVFDMTYEKVEGSGFNAE